MLFMIDIESTGVNLEDDDVLEIGIVQMKKKVDLGGYYSAGAIFHKFVYSDRKPESEFAKKHMAEVYKRANQAERLHSTEIRALILEFFTACGVVKNDQVQFCGWNASSFDVPMLHAKGMLEPPGYRTKDGVDMPVGDHGYRYYEMGGAISYAADIMDKPRDEVVSRVKEMVSDFIYPGKQHDALYDCHKQIALLNALIKLGRMNY